MAREYGANRTEQVVVRFTVEEKAQLKKAADSIGMTIS